MSFCGCRLNVRIETALVPGGNLGMGIAPQKTETAIEGHISLMQKTGPAGMIRRGLFLSVNGGFLSGDPSGAEPEAAGAGTKACGEDEEEH